VGQSSLQTWDLWFPAAAATGLPFARSRIDPVDGLLVHSAPPVLTVWVLDEEGRVQARGENLCATLESPIARLTLYDGEVRREDLWPGPDDVGRVVILPGGEAGILQGWWHAADHSEWRWQIELYNHR
jgi:hypothetical protein